MKAFVQLHVFILILCGAFYSNIGAVRVTQSHIEDVLDLQLEVQNKISGQSQLKLELEKKLKRFMNLHNQEKSKAAKIEDINVKSQTLENMSLEQVMKIAQKQSNQQAKNADPMDKVVQFLQQEQKLREKERQESRDKIIQEIVLDQQKQPNVPKGNDLLQTKEELQNEVLSQQKNLVLKEVKPNIPKSKFKDSDLESLKAELRKNIETEREKKQKLKDANKLTNDLKQLTAKMQKPAMSLSQLGSEVHAESQSLSSALSFDQKKALLEDHKKKESDAPVQNDLVSLSILESSNEFDNMSMAEIIQKKYKSHMKTNSFNTPEAAAKVMIKDTKEYDVNSEENTVGSKEEQELYQNELGEVETNLSEKWSDLGSVKQSLWQRLNTVQVSLRDKLHKHMSQLAQISPLNHMYHQQDVPVETPKHQITRHNNQSNIRPESQIPPTDKENIQTQGIGLGDFDIKLYEVDTVVVVVIVILAVMLGCCCICYWSTCCCVKNAANKARKEQEKAKRDMEREEMKKKKNKNEKATKHE